MRRALEGKSGYHGRERLSWTRVLAAYEHVPGLKLGWWLKLICLKSALPIIRTGLIIITVSLLIIIIGIMSNHPDQQSHYRKP